MLSTTCIYVYITNRSTILEKHKPILYSRRTYTKNQMNNVQQKRKIKERYKNKFSGKKLPKTVNKKYLTLYNNLKLNDPSASSTILNNVFNKHCSIVQSRGDYSNGGYRTKRRNNNKKEKIRCFYSNWILNSISRFYINETTI